MNETNFAGQRNELEEAPSTPSEKPRSRFDIHYDSTPLSQSPMLKITEEDMPSDASSQYASLVPPPSASKRHSMYGSPTIYGLDNDSSSSLYIPGGNVPGNRSSVTSLKYVPQIGAPMRAKSPVRGKSPVRTSSSPSRSRSKSPIKKPNGPFNFKSTQLTAPAISNSTRASHRKGHRYKHSSVSMNLFQEPKQRAPLRINVSYPIPTLGEFFASCSENQKLKLTWSLWHLTCSFIVFLTGFIYRLHSFSTLSHLIFYDSLGCIIIVLTDIMNNFDVYTKSSIKFPFGLGRIHVLFAFALSVSLIFLGCDLGSHFIEELLMGIFADPEHEQHGSGHNQHNTEPDHSEVGYLLYETLCLLTIIITSISSKIEGSMTHTSLTALMMHSPTHLITLVFSIYLALTPILQNVHTSFGIDNVATLAIASLIIYMGSKAVKYLGFIILLSFPKKDTKMLELKGDIQALEIFSSNYSLENVIISQVHMDLVVVLVSVKMVGRSDEQETALRNKIDELIRKTVTSKTVETTIDIDRL